MSTTQERLDAYQAAELKVLAGQRVRYGERDLTLADLAEIRKAISQLQQQLRVETATPGSGGSLSYKTGVFCR